MMKILIVLDSESYKYPPVMMGRMIAETNPAEVHVLVVVPREGHLENGNDIVEQVRKDLGDLNPQVNIEEGSAGRIIQELLNEQEFQLIIVNAERILRLRKTIEIDPILIKQTEISVLVTQNMKPRIKRILLCTGCIEEGYALVEQAANFASHIGASVTMLHVVAGSVPSMYTGLEQIEETVEELLQTDTNYARYLRKGVEILTDKKLESEVKIRRGIPLEEIVRETQLENYDMVVIGSTHVNQGLKEMLLGNLTIKIIDQVELPVLVVGSRDLEE